MTQISHFPMARRALLVAFAALVVFLAGCGSKNDDANAQAVANDPAKSAAVTQKGVEADAANQQARQADEARRAAQKQ